MRGPLLVIIKDKEKKKLYFKYNRHAGLQSLRGIQDSVVTLKKIDLFFINFS